MLINKYLDPTNHTFKQRQILLNNIHSSNDAQNLESESATSVCNEALAGNIFDGKFDKDLQT